jgi:hypothetical protein
MMALRDRMSGAPFRPDADWMSLPTGPTWRQEDTRPAKNDAHA